MSRSRVGRFERRILSAIAIASVVPLIGALVFGRQALLEAYSVGVNPRLSAELEASLESYRAQLRAVRESAERAADGIAHDHELTAAVEADSEDAIRTRLTALLTDHEDVTRIAVRGLLVERPAPEDVRAIELEETLPTGDPIQVTLVTPAEPFRAYVRAGETAEVYRHLEAETDYVSAFFLITYLALVLSVIVVAALVATLLSRRITRRVQRLAEATELVGKGDLSIEVPVEGDDEVAELTRAFNAMVRDVRSSRDRIDYLERVGAWQDMARRLAHEIKNPLTPIQLAMQEVHDRYPGGDPKFQRTLDGAREMVEEEIRTLRRLVHDFSEFARLPTPVLTPADLGDFVRENAPHLDPGGLREEGADRTTSPPVLELEVDAAALPVSIDAPMLRRALDNLVRNAVHALDAVRPHRGGHVVIRTRQDGGQAVLEVEDDGPGIPPADRERVFSPYVTTKAEGTGLGLSIVKKLVLEHGGTIACREGTLGGALFVVRLPIRSEGSKTRT